MGENARFFLLQYTLFFFFGSKNWAWEVAWNSFHQFVHTVQTSPQGLLTNIVAGNWKFRGFVDSKTTLEPVYGNASIYKSLLLLRNSRWMANHLFCYTKLFREANKKFFIIKARISNKKRGWEDDLSNVTIVNNLLQRRWEKRRNAWEIRRYRERGGS